MNARRPVAILATLLLAAGCQPSGAEKFDVPYGINADQLVGENGLSVNGVSANGLSANGLSANGLSANGLSAATLGSTSFRSWFNANLLIAPIAMKYLVLCAAPSGKTITWTNPSTGITYNWAGGIGVAPSYANGSAPTLTEKQLVTGCLLAHVNKYGRQVSIAVEGQTATGAQIPMVNGEFTTYSFYEGAFFGNLYDSTDGLFSCSDSFAGQTRDVSSLRACAIDYSPSSSGDDCAPMVNVGSCGTYCTVDSTGVYYTSCTYNGRTYKPITTNILPADVYRCGDGVCQVTEKKGTGTTFDSCKADCGS